MAQNLLKPGTHGLVQIQKIGPREYRARVYYRDERSNRRCMTARGDSKGAARNKFAQKWKEISKRMHTGGSSEAVTIERLFDDWAGYEDEKIKSLRNRGIAPHIEPHTHHQYKGLVTNHLLPR